DEPAERARCEATPGAGAEEHIVLYPSACLAVVPCQDYLDRRTLRERLQTLVLQREAAVRGDIDRIREGVAISVNKPTAPYPGDRLQRNQVTMKPIRLGPIE